MNVEVIIPSKSIIGGIGRDLLNKDIILPDDDLEYQVKQAVKEKFLQKYNMNI